MKQRVHGTVRWFNPIKGYGFIGLDHDDDIFVHYSSIYPNGLRHLEEGQQVEFSIAESPKGLQAIDVIPLN
jgi:CspA family cold shock protein